MDGLSALLVYLPSAPEYQWNWEGLKLTPLASLFEPMAQTLRQREWHGKGDVWTHIRMVSEELARLDGHRVLPVRQQQELALAALPHDAGKVFRARLEGRRADVPGHGAAGAQEARKLLWRGFALAGEAEGQNFRETICLLICYHTVPLHLPD